MSIHYSAIKARKTRSLPPELLMEDLHLQTRSQQTQSKPSQKNLLFIDFVVIPNCKVFCLGFGRFETGAWVMANTINASQTLK
jgi:hypothetical protein